MVDRLPNSPPNEDFSALWNRGGKVSGATSHYYDEAWMSEALAKGTHRDIIGGMWDEIGQLQFEFMVRRGLRPEHRLLDLGCGSFRGGVRFVPYLEPRNYFGIDISRDLMDAGYANEIVPAGLADRFPPTNYFASADFDAASFGVSFDRVLALSVFTHLTFNHIRVCLERLAPCVKQGGEFYASYFDLPDGEPSYLPRLHEAGGIITHGTKDPFHYRQATFYHATSGLPWRFENVGDFGHPRDQRMAVFVRV